MLFELNYRYVQSKEWHVSILHSYLGENQKDKDKEHIVHIITQYSAFIVTFGISFWHPRGASVVALK